MKIFVSAAEISSDIQAETLISAFISEYTKKFPGHRVEVSGIGGPRLRSIPGFQTIVEAESMRAMGFVEVLAKLSSLKKTLDQTVDFIRVYQPDLILTFDYPDFHFQLMRRLQGIAPNALRVCGIPPKVWVWRSHRIEKIRALYDGVWVIFPFEKKFYEDHSIPVIYEGNPLIAKLVSDKNHGIQSKPGFLPIAVMPGSRDAELAQHLPLIPKALRLLSKQINQPIEALVPIPKGVSVQKIKDALISDSTVSYQFFEDGAKQVLSNTSVGLIKSGTSTLEAAVLGCVPVIVYKANWLSEVIFTRLVRYKGPVGLPNILLGIQRRQDSIFPELILNEATPERIAAELAKIVQNPNVLEQKNQVGRKLCAELVPTENVPNAIASKLLSWIHERPRSGRLSLVAHGERKFLIACVSLLWSVVNYTRRKLYRLGWFKAIKPSVPSILVGNIQAGGAGKTPLVIAIAQEAVKQGKRVAILSRGYGVIRKGEVRVVLPGEKAIASEIGDEPSEMRLALPQVVLGLGADRVAVLKKLPAVDLIIFDDGFQNLKFKADRTVLCLTHRSRSEIPFRDFSSQIKYADLTLRAEDLDWEIQQLPVAPVWLLCAVGDPASVVRFYEKRGVTIKRLIAKPDHAVFDETEVSALQARAAEAGCLLAVTEKDFVKLADKFPTLFVFRRRLRSRDWIQHLF